MRDISNRYREMVASVPPGIKAEIDLSFAISNRIETLMRERGLNKKQFAEALGKRPSEISKWLSGQHNFTITTLSMLSTFFGRPIITVG
jgi:antitoxin component HigA of HigAB toxin-antitoxin module